MVRRRKQDWPTAMAAFLQEAGGRPFEWGAWDCCLFALAHADNITGSGFYSDWRGLCADRAGAESLLGSLGGLALATSALFGQPLDTPRKAQRGDVVMFETDEGAALGVVGLEGTHFYAVSEVGLARLKMGRAVKAWRI